MNASDYVRLKADYAEAQNMINDLETRIYGMETILTRKDREIGRLRAIENARILEEVEGPCEPST